MREIFERNLPLAIPLFYCERHLWFFFPIWSDNFQTTGLSSSTGHREVIPDWLSCIRQALFWCRRSWGLNVSGYPNWLAKIDVQTQQPSSSIARLTEYQDWLFSALPHQDNFLALRPVARRYLQQINTRCHRPAILMLTIPDNFMPTGGLPGTVKFFHRSTQEIINFYFDLGRLRQQIFNGKGRIKWIGIRLI